MVETRYTGSSSTPFSKVKLGWTYDASNRLVQETRDTDTTPGDANDDFGSRDTVAGNYSDFFEYDLAGNRMRKTHGWDADANGAIDGSDPVDARTAYVYNTRDQLTGEGPNANNDRVPDSIATAYTYDANGSQSTVTTAGVPHYYLWDLRNRIVGISLNSDGDSACGHTRKVVVQPLISGMLTEPFKRYISMNSTTESIVEIGKYVIKALLRPETCTAHR